MPCIALKELVGMSLNGIYEMLCSILQQKKLFVLSPVVCVGYKNLMEIAEHFSTVLREIVIHICIVITMISNNLVEKKRN